MGVGIEFFSVGHYISPVILWGCPPNNEGKNKDPSGRVKCKESQDVGVSPQL